MITIKLLGGAKKSFGTESVTAQLDSVTLEELVGYLLSVKPKDTMDLDTKNVLIAVNGVDSSALDGLKTIVRSGDSVSIIPVIHGGEKRHQLKAGKARAELFNVSLKKGKNYQYLENVRKKFPKLVVVGVDSRCVLGSTHAEKILGLSVFAKENDLLLSKKLETDILLRFASTSQILEAIRRIGIENNDDFTIIAVGSRSQLDKLKEFLGIQVSRFDYKKNSSFIQKHFQVTQKNLDAILSKAPLEDLLVERAAILIR